MRDARIPHPTVSADSATCYSARHPTYSGGPAEISQAIEGPFDYHLLLFAVEFTDARRGHCILPASVVFEWFLEDLSRTRADMRPSTLVARFFLHPVHVTRHTAEHLLQRLKREWTQLLDSDDCDTPTEPARLPFFHEVVVQLARDEDDPFGTVRPDERVGQHGLECVWLLKLGQ